jgi:hypothetical protein
MARQTYDKGRRAFTDRAHLLARRQFYPQLFGSNNLRYHVPQSEEEQAEALRRDMEEAVDWTILVPYPTLPHLTKVHVTERFRRHDQLHWQELTLREFLSAVDRPGEWYNMRCTLVIYGWVNEEETDFLDIFAVPVGGLQVAFTTVFNGIGHNKSHGNRFVTFPLQKLTEAGLVYRSPQQQKVYLPIRGQCGICETSTPIEQMHRQWQGPPWWVCRDCVDQRDRERLGL